MLVGAEYTFILQHQTRLRSPYAGPLSLDPNGDTQPTHTIGIYAGWSCTDWAQLYVDTEKFMGAGTSGATGMAGLPNGEVVREGSSGLKKSFYIARSFVRLMLALRIETSPVERTQDQLPGNEATTRFEVKFGRLSVSDDFDHNRYANSARTQFMNWSLWDNTSWDYAANTRGYTDGGMIAFVSPEWTLKYGIYRMPVMANGQTLESSLQRARGENMELTLSPKSVSTIIRVLAYRNTANMGNYQEALTNAALTNSVPDIVADDRAGRHKTGVGINIEQPVADEGESGIFLRMGKNDGHTESFAFTEVDQHLSVGAQLSGSHWNRTDDRWGIAMASDGLSATHRQYLADRGSGFLLDDGHLNYAHEEIVESYYRAQHSWTDAQLKIQLSPDFQYVRNPGYNQDRGPVRFWSVRLHVEY